VEKCTCDLHGFVEKLGLGVGDRGVSTEPRAIAGEKCCAPVSAEPQGAELKPCSAAPPPALELSVLF